MIELDRDPEELAGLMAKLNEFVRDQVPGNDIDSTVWLAQLGDRLVLHAYAIRDRLGAADWGRSLIGLQLLLRMTAKAVDVVAQEGVGEIGWPTFKTDLP